MSCSKYLSCFPVQLRGESMCHVSCVYFSIHRDVQGNLVFTKTFFFPPIKEMDASLGNRSPFAKTQVILFRDMYFLKYLIYGNAYKCQQNVL